MQEFLPYLPAAFIVSYVVIHVAWDAWHALK